VELAFIALSIAAIYWFLMNGGPTWFGEWFADSLTDTP